MLHRTSQRLARPCQRAAPPVRTHVKAMGLFGMFGSSASAGRGCQPAPAQPPAGLKYATFAGGCFWSVELAYQRVPGVVSTWVGYTQGEKLNPTYDEVCSGRTGHTEGVLMTYDPNEVSYDKLLDVFFDKVDPTTKNRQGNDVGTQYRSGLYYHDDEQKEAILKKVAEVNEKLASGVWGKLSGSKVVSEVLPANEFYIAEQYHQQYLAKGGRNGRAQSAAKGCTDPIRCYG